LQSAVKFNDGNSDNFFKSKAFYLKSLEVGLDAQLGVVCGWMTGLVRLWVSSIKERVGAFVC
jgi:hypothetical protein